LLLKQQRYRLEYLLKNGLLDEATRATIDGVEERIGNAWSEAEELALAAKLPEYQELALAIDEIKSKREPAGFLNEAGKRLEQDPEYGKARSALADRAKRRND
jgi:hypothetical protein